ncbi:protein Dok-7 isoform X4 [Perognathus longimembris pacificus]|uniref:protein Dok-7 isoform X4 n=1 Tax=Perognathus longimembris pacificus TaxID=214514 RepID=UPI0020192BEE|nr:protein Dok-7 isoform X4 [Perognathus longimembris pacificus]
MTEAALVEGQVKLRDGKKWKSRWLVLRKPSPVAGAGVFFLSSTEGEQISFLFDCIVRGISPTKGPFGLRPVLPDPGPGGPSASEERGAQEAQEALEALKLEKRLSLLSPPGRPGSGGDDRSLSSSSSEASHSDLGAGGRGAPWPEPSPSSSAGASREGPGGAPGPGEAAPGAPGPPPAPPRPRQLREVGRQSSSDSGIATGSRSSCSGSFSSYAGSSLDVWRAAEELGSLLSLPPGAAAPEPGPCGCPPGAAEYQVPGPPRRHYDTPRGLRPAPRDPADPAARPPGRPWEAGSPPARPAPAPGPACPACGGLQVKPPP